MEDSAIKADASKFDTHETVETKPDSNLEQVIAQRPPRIGDTRPAPTAPPGGLTPGQENQRKNRRGNQRANQQANQQGKPVQPGRSNQQDTGNQQDKQSGRNKPNKNQPASKNQAGNNNQSGNQNNLQGGRSGQAKSNDKPGKQDTSKQDTSKHATGKQDTGKQDMGKSSDKKTSNKDARPQTASDKKIEQTLGRYLLLVHVEKDAIHVALLEGRSLIEYSVSHRGDTSDQIHGNIYSGRVENVLPSMESAFVDIGSPKNAVLYQGDVVYNTEEFEASDSNPIIHKVLQPKQTIMCQVTKNPIGHKGARLTQEVSLAGRSVVLVPNFNQIRVSKQLTDRERKRHREMIRKLIPDQHGAIVRTAAKNSTRSDIEADVRQLLADWSKIEEKAKSAKVPALLYQEPNIAVHAIREQFNSDYRGVLVNDREMFETLRNYAESAIPKLASRVQFYDERQDPLPLFDRYHVKSQLRKALDKKVWLPSGGSLIIESTEALTVIDVNTGRNLGRNNLRDTIFQNNQEAAEEIARQLRLRDIGGIIVIDFVDMDSPTERKKLMQVFRDALARDKTRMHVIDISDLGLVQMTRKRNRAGLVESFTDWCEKCEGDGHTLKPLLEGL